MLLFFFFLCVQFSSRNRLTLPGYFPSGKAWVSMAQNKEVLSLTFVSVSFCLIWPPLVSSYILLSPLCPLVLICLFFSFCLIFILWSHFVSSSFFLSPFVFSCLFFCLPLSWVISFNHLWYYIFSWIFLFFVTYLLLFSFLLLLAPPPPSLLKWGVIIWLSV